jgi:hypothetical protein
MGGTGLPARFRRQLAAESPDGLVNLFHPDLDFQTDFESRLEHKIHATTTTMITVRKHETISTLKRYKYHSYSCHLLLPILRSYS